jgi:hypothetical protein
MARKETCYETVGVEVINRLEALVQAEGRSATFECGLSGEFIPSDLEPAVRHTNDDSFRKWQEIFVEANPIGA